MPLVDGEAYRFMDRHKRAIYMSVEFKLQGYPGFCIIGSSLCGLVTMKVAITNGLGEPEGSAHFCQTHAPTTPPALLKTTRRALARQVG